MNHVNLADFDQTLTFYGNVVDVDKNASRKHDALTRTTPYTNLPKAHVSNTFFFSYYNLTIVL